MSFRKLGKKMRQIQEEWDQLPSSFYRGSWKKGDSQEMIWTRNIVLKLKSDKTN